MSDTDHPTWVTLAEAAQRLNMHPRMAQRKAAAGEDLIPGVVRCVRYSQRRVMVSTYDLQRAEALARGEPGTRAVSA